MKRLSMTKILKETSEWLKSRTEEMRRRRERPTMEELLHDLKTIEENIADAEYSFDNEEEHFQLQDERDRILAKIENLKNQAAMAGNQVHPQQRADIDERIRGQERYRAGMSRFPHRG